MNFTIIGERHSGTNFLQKTIEQNFDLSITWDYGFKHWMGFNDEKIKNANNTIFFCISRNVFDWCTAMHQEPHHVKHMKIKGKKQFLTETWHSEHISPTLGEIIEDRNYKTGKKYKNIFELRSMKLKYMHSVKRIQNNTYNLTYENLCDNYDNEINKISEVCNLKKIEHVTKLVVKKSQPSKNLLRYELVDLITTNTDWEAEELWGYKNDFIL